MPVLKWLEHAFLKNASAVIANTDAAMLSLAARFPTFRRKLQFICNGFDPENPVPPLPIPSRDRKILSHVGELYFGRNPRLILESIARLIEEGRLDGRKIGVKLVGKIADRSLLCQQAFLAAKAQGWLELKPEQVSQVDARHTAQTSDGLFLIQPQSDTQVPGKLFEYLQIGRPVLALIKRGSASERILEKSGVRFECVYPNSSPEETDRAVYRFFNLPSAPVAPSPLFEEHFNAENQVRILDQLICGFHVESAAQRKCRAIRGEGVPVPSCRHDLRSAD
jgi:glycosyltransferase involved in cell wall biosynthesis